MQILNKFDTKHPQVKDILVCLSEGPHLFFRGDSYKIARIRNFKILFCRPIKLISAKLGTNQFWLKELKISSNEEVRPFQREDDYEKHCCNLKKIFPFQNHWVNFNQTWHKASLCDGNSSLCKKEPLNSQKVDSGFFLILIICKFFMI